jgi:hypothetical protein
MAPHLPDADQHDYPAGQTRELPVPAQEASTHARVSDHAGLPEHSRERARSYCLPLSLQRRHPGYSYRGSMAGLCPPLPTLQRWPRGHRCTAWGRCGSLLLHRAGLSPTTSRQSPGAQRFELLTPKIRSPGAATNLEPRSGCLEGLQLLSRRKVTRSRAADLDLRGGEISHSRVAPRRAARPRFGVCSACRQPPGDWGIDQGQLIIRSSRPLAELQHLRRTELRHRRDSSAAACDHNPLIQISLTIDCICDSFAVSFWCSTTADSPRTTPRSCPTG